MKQDLRVLPYRNLPVVDFPIESPKFRAEIIKEWSDGDLQKYSFGFVFSAQDPKDYSDYYIPIADVVDGRLFTSREIILTIINQIKEIKFSYDEEELREHLDLYFKILNLLPSWGEARYYHLLSKGKTPRILYGPHIGGSLRPNQKRQVLLDDEKEFVYGPLIP